MRNPSLRIGLKILLPVFASIASIGVGGCAGTPASRAPRDTAVAEPKSTALSGVWKFTEIKATGPNAHTNSKPLPGLLIFTGRHYSVVHVTSDDPRPPLPDVEKATAAELLKAYRPFLANAGTYVISGETLSMYPVVAKNPNMKPGESFDTYTFRLQGSTLTVTEVGNAKGPIANPASITLTRIE